MSKSTVQKRQKDGSTQKRGRTINKHSDPLLSNQKNKQNIDISTVLTKSIQIDSHPKLRKETKNSSSLHLSNYKIRPSIAINTAHIRLTLSIDRKQKIDQKRNSNFLLLSLKISLNTKENTVPIKQILTTAQKQKEEKIRKSFLLLLSNSKTNHSIKVDTVLTKQIHSTNLEQKKQQDNN